MRTTSVAMFERIVMNVITQPYEFIFVADNMLPEAALPHGSLAFLLPRSALLDVGWVETHPTLTSRRSQSDSSRCNNGQAALKLGQDIGLLQQGFNQSRNEYSSRVARQLQDNNPGVCRRDIVADVGKPKVSGHETDPVVLGMRSDLRVFRACQPNIAHVGGSMPIALKQRFHRTGQVSINQKVHGRVSLRGRQRMMFFLVNHLAGIGKRRANIVLGHSILVDDVCYAHPSGQTAEDTHHRHPSSANHRLAVLNRWVDHNTVVHRDSPLWSEHTVVTIPALSMSGMKVASPEWSDKRNVSQRRESV
jgi:hypothetical protein